MRTVSDRYTVDYGKLAQIFTKRIHENVRQQSSLTYYISSIVRDNVGRRRHTGGVDSPQLHHDNREGHHGLLGRHDGNPQGVRTSQRTFPVSR